MASLTAEERTAILRLARQKVSAGHVIGTCQSRPDKKTANPRKGYCLRGAIEDAAREKGFSPYRAKKIAYDPQATLGLALGGVAPCLFSDDQGKAGCLRVIDKALAA